MRRNNNMLNMDQNKITEAINQQIINKYMQNICTVKTRMIKLYTAMPFSGAPNISDAQNIAIIEDLAGFLTKNYSSPNN